MKKILTILSLLLTMPTYVFAGIGETSGSTSGGTTIGPVIGGGGNETCPARPDYTTVNFYGIKSDGNFGLLKSVEYDHNNKKWCDPSSTLCSAYVTKLENLNFALNYNKSFTYGGTKYTNGLTAYAAMYAGAGDDDLEAPDAPTNLIVTKTTNPVATTTTNPNITISGYLPSLNSKIQKSDNSYATQVNYILLYAANCLDTTGATSGAKCSLNVNGGRAIYTNTCLGGHKYDGAFGSTTVQAAATVSVASGTYQKPCS